jgi:hypothetical protein
MIYPEPEKGGREMPLRHQWPRRVVTVGLGDVGGVVAIFWREEANAAEQDATLPD